MTATMTPTPTPAARSRGGGRQERPPQAVASVILLIVAGALLRAVRIRVTTGADNLTSSGLIRGSLALAVPIGLALSPAVNGPAWSTSALRA